MPDETTHCRFRNSLTKADFFDKLLDEVNHQLEAKGIKAKQAEAAIIDATLIQSAARSKRKPDFIAKDRDEEDLEQCFGTAKRLFGLARARYFGRAKVAAQMAVTAVCMSLLKVANLIILAQFVICMHGF